MSKHFSIAAVLVPVALCSCVAGLVGCGGSSPTGPLTDSVGNQLTPLDARIVRENAGKEVSSHLLARVQVQDDELLEFYELSPGHISLSGAGAPAHGMKFGPRSIRGLSVAQVWKLAAPGKPMPSALSAALAKATPNQAARPSQTGQTQEGLQQTSGANTSSHESGGGSASPPGSASPDTGSGYCDTGYYTDSYGDCPSGYDFEVCLDNWWNGAYAYDTDEYYDYTNVCPATGNVLFKVQDTEGDGGEWTVDQNTVRWHHNVDTDCGDTFWEPSCEYARADVLNASGVRFQFRFFTQDPP
jgi:hypothetical protein